MSWTRRRGWCGEIAVDRDGAALSAIERGVFSVTDLRVTSRRQVESCIVQIAYFSSSGCNRRTRRILRVWSDYEIYYEIYDNGALPSGSHR